MMRSAAAAAVALLLCAAAPAAAESLNAPPPPGWVSSGAHRVRGGVTEDFRPPGQTTTRWTRLFTVQRKEGDGRRIASSTFIALLAKGYLAACPGGRADVVPMGREAGVRIDCLRTDQTTFARAIPGPRDMHIVQIAFHGLVLPNDAQWARDKLGAAFVIP